MLSLVEKWRWQTQQRFPHGAVDNPNDNLQNGTDGSDRVFSVASGDDGSVVLAGYTEGSSSETQMGYQDFAVVKLSANGTEEWRWQDGTQYGEAIFGAGVGKDGSIFLFGGTTGQWGDLHYGSADFIVTKLHSNGSLLWEWQGGSLGYDQANMGALFSDGSAFYVGHTYEDWNRTNMGGRDFAGGMITADGDELWRWQAGTAGNDTAMFTSIGEDDTIIISGYTDGDWGGENAGRNDFAAMKVASDGTVLWRWQDGTDGEDIFSSNAVGLDGSVYICGFTYGNWDRVNRGDQDFAAVKLDSEGDEVWRWQEGTPGTDRMESVTVAEDGAIFLAGATGGNWVRNVFFGMDFALAKLDPEGEVLWRWQEGVNNGDQYFVGVTTGQRGIIYAGGYSEGDWVGASNGDLDFVALAFMGDEDPIGTWSPTASPVVESPAPLDPTEIPTISPSGESPKPSPSTLGPDISLPTPVPSPAPVRFETPSPTALSTMGKPSSSSGSSELHEVRILCGAIGGALSVIISLVVCFYCRNRRDQGEQPPPATRQRTFRIANRAPSQESSITSPPEIPAPSKRPAPPTYRDVAALPSSRSVRKLPSYRSIFGRTPGQ